MEFVDNIMIDAKVRMWKMGERIKGFFKEEHGVSNVVATVILVLIVVLIIAVFWNRLSKWLKNMMDSIFSEKVPSKGDLGG